MLGRISSTFNSFAAKRLSSNRNDGLENVTIDF